MLRQLVTVHTEEKAGGHALSSVPLLFYSISWLLLTVEGDRRLMQASFYIWFIFLRLSLQPQEANLLFFLLF